MALRITLNKHWVFATILANAINLRVLFVRLKHIEIEKRIISSILKANHTMPVKSDRCNSCGYSDLPWLLSMPIFISAFVNSPIQYWPIKTASCWSHLYVRLKSTARLEWVRFWLSSHISQWAVFSLSINAWIEYAYTTLNSLLFLRWSQSIGQ